MLIVRFPTGVTIVYNDATYVSYKQHAWELYTCSPEKGGTWVASISPQSDCVVESMRACDVSNPVEHLTGEKALEEVTHRIRTFKNGQGRHLAQLKRDLRDFDSTQKRWKR